MSKIKFIALLVICISVMAILSRCAKDTGKPPQATVSSCDTITYTKHIQPIMVKSCISCHGEPLSGGAPIYLNTYSSVKTSGSNGTLKNEVIVKGSMPLGGPALPQAEQDLINCWLSNGMKE